MAGSTTKTVQGFVLGIGFPTNGQAKELPIATKNASGKTSPRTKPELCQHKAGLPLTG